MTEIVSDYTPGRSLFAEMTDIKEQMTALKTAMLQLVELQRDLHTRFDSALKGVSTWEQPNSPLTTKQPS